jgi:hypothetical protein
VQALGNGPGRPPPPDASAPRVANGTPPPRPGAPRPPGSPGATTTPRPPAPPGAVPPLPGKKNIGFL